MPQKDPSLQARMFSLRWCVVCRAPHCSGFYRYGHDDDEEEDDESSIVIIIIIIVPVILVIRGCGISHPEKQNTVHKKHRPPQHTFLYQSYCCYYCHHYDSIVVVLLLLRLLFVKGLGF